MNNNYTATILSLKYVNNIPGVRMNMDKSTEKAMNIIMSDRTVLKFNLCVSGLYYYDMASNDDNNSAKTNTIISPTTCYKL